MDEKLPLKAMGFVLVQSLSVCLILAVLVFGLLLFHFLALHCRFFAALNDVINVNTLSPVVK